MSFKAEVLPLEAEVCRHVSRIDSAAEASREGKPEAEAAGGRPQPGQEDAPGGFRRMTPTAVCL
jgi:hypothetical protein